MLKSAQLSIVGKHHQLALQKGSDQKNALSNTAIKFQTQFLAQTGLQPNDLRWLANGINVWKPSDALEFDYGTLTGELTVVVLLNEETTHQAKFTLRLRANEHGSQFLGYNNIETHVSHPFAQIISNMCSDLNDFFRKVSLNGSQSFQISFPSQSIKYY